jgi:hypothetical protein
MFTFDIQVVSYISVHVLFLLFLSPPPVFLLEAVNHSFNRAYVLLL